MSVCLYVFGNEWEVSMGIIMLPLMMNGKFTHAMMKWWYVNVMKWWYVYVMKWCYDEIR